MSALRQEQLLEEIVSCRANTAYVDCVCFFCGLLSGI